MNIHNISKYILIVVFLMAKCVLFGQTQTLIVLAHPNLEESEVNSSFQSKLEAVEHVFVNDLYANYADFEIDVVKEQQLLIDHDIIIFQFPLHWFSSPALLRKWQDEVFTSAFAIREGHKVKGKKFMVVVSVGGTQANYRSGGLMDVSMDEILTPFETFAKLTEMHYLPPFITYGVPNPKILNIPMNMGEKNLRRQRIELKGEELVKLILDIQNREN